MKLPKHLMRYQLRYRLLSVSFIVTLQLSLSTCKEDKFYPIFNDKGNIGPEGGIIKTDDGASVEIPAGLLTGSKTISISNITSSEAVANTDCRIYEIKPDGLTFNDSVLITLPFDDAYLNTTTQERNYGIGIMVFQDSGWIDLKVTIDLQKKLAKAKTLHFSYYVVYYPGAYNDYFNENNNKSTCIYSVPYYFQGSYPWCTYYSLSMLTKYAGYEYKAPFLATLFNETTGTGFTGGDSFFLNGKLNDLDIKSEISIPTWHNILNLRGYVLKQLDLGNPVLIFSGTLNHTFVVVGHDDKNFYINDPSGFFVRKVHPSLSEAELASVPISYQQFTNLLVGSLNITNYTFIGNEITVVLKSRGSQNNFWGTLNFLSISSGYVSLGYPVFLIKNQNGNIVGELEIEGKQYSPNGYCLKNLTSNNNTFNGSDYMEIKPIVGNGDARNPLIANLHYKIDNVDVKGSPIILSIPKGNTYYLPQLFKTSLSNLSKGNHTLNIELESSDGKDSWEFPFKIENEVFGQPPDANFESSSTTVIVGSAIFFNDLSLNNPTEWRWDFGDGTTATTQNPSHTYLNPGTYVVTLTASNSFGTNSETKPDYITVRPNTGDGQILFNPNLTYGTVSDIEGNVYRTIQIGTQIWMAENLKTTTFNDNTFIPLVTDKNSWINLTTPGFCWYNNDMSTVKNTYGAIYNWFTVSTKKICPNGWHVPSNAEWQVLQTYLGNATISYNKLREIGTGHWIEGDLNVTNESGFTGLPSGLRFPMGDFGSLGELALWWSSDDLTDGDVSLGLYAALNQSLKNFSLGGSWKYLGISIRCLKN